MANTNELLRQRFAEAVQERDALMEQTTPLREQRDAIMAKARAAELKAQPLDEQIKGLEAPLYDLNNEIARISRALDGNTAAE